MGNRVCVHYSVTYQDFSVWDQFKQQYKNKLGVLKRSVCEKWNFLLIDATDRNKISSDQRRFFIALSLNPLSFFANTPFKKIPNFVNYYFDVNNTSQENINVRKIGL